jgi:GDPmannose 4,6-dehydratase
VIGSNESHSVQEFLGEAFGYLNMDWHEYVKIDLRYFRPNEVDFLQGDAGKASRVLGWEPRVCFKDLVKVMVDANMELIGLQSKGEGKKILENK